MGKHYNFGLSHVIFITEDNGQRPDPGTGRPSGRDMGWQDKIAAPGADAGSTRMQYGALCWRLAEKDVEILLITSRDTVRWVIPKGWPMPGLSPDVGILTNLTPDHLDRHGAMEHYAAVKSRMFTKQRDGQTALVGVDDDWGSSIADHIHVGPEVGRVSV